MIWPSRSGRSATIPAAYRRDGAEPVSPWVIDAHLPPPGTATQPVEAGYMANAYVRMRHPDYDTLRGMLDNVGRTLHVYAS